ncbi:Npt1/Npt2 family nucleotide transporter [uncultured Draconibacterium sp.]|uniref:Npt1/Npt2 family nucleotide transporter n=1 Tax=uncultured Draconibacterium sp. TaxID=1573823 RepID=UPI0032177C98
MRNSQLIWNNETIGKAIKYLLSRFFDLREGEYKRAFLMQLNIFLIISTLLIVKPAVNGLFIAKFGVENLPLAFVLVAISASALSIYYSRKLVKLTFYLLMRRTLLISVITLIVFGFLLTFNFLEGWVVYLFYLWVALFAVLSASQFWILANLVFNPREAKRLFGFIGAGAIAGGIFGGYLTSLLAPVLGSENLLFVSAFLLSFCLPITRIVWHENLSGKNNPFKNKNKLKEVVESPFQLIRKSKHLTYLAGIIGVGVIVAKLVDYQFNAIASLKISDPDELTAFFGFWFSNFNVFSLLIQLFLTRRVVGVFGVGTSLFFLPAGIFIGAALVLFAPTLFAAILIKMADGSLKQSINKSAVELLALPIPLSIKNKTKTFIDVFVDSVATGIGGIILILIVNAFQLSTSFISLIILAILGVWIFFAIKIRKEYIKSFQLKLKQTSHKKGSKKINIANESVIRGLQNVLENGNEDQIMWVLQKTKEKPNEKLFAPIFQLLKHPAANIRAEALRNLYFHQQKSVVDTAYQMISDPAQEVKISAFEYLLEHHPENRVELMQQFLLDDDYKINAAALLSLAGEMRDNPELKKQYELRRIVAEKVEALKAENDTEIKLFKTKSLLEVIGKGNMPGFYNFIQDGLNHNNEEIVNQAIKAAGLSMAPEFIDPLIQFVSKPQFSEIATLALAQYGVEIITFLRSVLADNTKIEIQRKIPGIVENIESQHSVLFLFELMESEDFQLRNKALTSLGILKIKFPFLYFDKKIVIQRILEEVRVLQDTLSILYLQTKLEQETENPANDLSDARKSLIDLLERRLDGGLKRIFGLLGLKYPNEEINSAYQSFQSNKADIRISSIEFLDNLLDTKLKRVLIPILETTILETLSDTALKQLNIDIPGEKECYNMLLEGNDIKIKLAVLYLIAQLKNPDYLPLIERYRKNKNQKVRDFAEKAFLALQ